MGMNEIYCTQNSHRYFCEIREAKGVLVLLMSKNLRILIYARVVIDTKRVVYV